MIRIGPEGIGGGNFETHVLIYQITRSHVLKVSTSSWKLNEALRTNDR
jgi:hypothetical protein